MTPESPLPSQRDQPLDAIVEEADRSPLVAAPYPYAAQPLPSASVPVVFEVRPQDIYRPPGLFQFERPAPAQYVVPRRFGMSAIFGIITALAVLFGSFRSYDVHPVLYLFFGVQAIVICLAQMLYGKTPRAASAITGAVLLPLFFVVGASVSFRHTPEGFPCVVVGCIPIGAFLGYLTGTLAAGVFLLMDAAERFLPAAPATPPAAAKHR
jgi:hypothetical protein